MRLGFTPITTLYTNESLVYLPKVKTPSANNSTQTSNGNSSPTPLNKGSLI